MKTQFLYGLLFIFISTFANGTNYYISNSGNDSNDGRSPDRAWKSITKVNTSSFQPGDSVLFRKGDKFSGTIIVKNNGTITKPIVYAAYGIGDLPEFSGFERLTNWNNYGNGIYFANTKAKKSLNMVVVNGLNTGIGRHPNDNYLTIDQYANGVLTDNEINEQINWVGATLALRSSKFTLEKRVVNSQNGKQLVFTPTDYNFGYTNGYFFQNHLKTLDKFGEWFCDGGKLYVYFGNNNPASQDLYVSITDTFALLRYKKHITFQDLSVKGYNEQVFTINSSSNIKIKNCNINFSGNYVVWGGSNWGATSENFLLENCTINNTNTSPIVLYNEFGSAKIINNKINNSGVINGMKKEGGKYAAISTWQTDKLLIEGNEIKNTGFNAICFIGDSITIKNNYIDTFCINLDDGAGIYTYSGSKADDNAGFVIDGNIVMNGIGNSDGTRDNEKAAFGIYLDDATDHTIIRNNTVYNCAYGGIYLHNNQHIILDNNLIINNMYQLFINHGSGVPTMPMRNITSTNNTFVSYTSNQKVIYYVTIESAYISMGEFSNNKYFNIETDNPIFTLSLKGWGNAKNYTLNTWAQITQLDSNSSSKMPSNTIPNYFLAINPSRQNSNISLPNIKMVDSKGTSFFNTTKLLPFQGRFLFNAKYDEQIISLKKGWNLISFNLICQNDSPISLLSPLFVSESFEKIQNQKGQSIELISKDSLLNNIQKINFIEGYKLKVSKDDTLKLQGYFYENPQTIQLKKGWNLMPILLKDSIDAQEFFNNLIQSEILVKAKDEKGQTLENYSVFGNWKNNIGYLKPGRSYEVKVKYDTEIVFE